MPNQRALVRMRAGGPAVLADVGQHVDFRVSRVAVLVEDVHLQLAEAAAEGNQLLFVELLGGKHQQQVLAEGLVNLLKILQAGKIDPRHLGAHHGGERPDLHYSRGILASATTRRHFSRSFLTSVPSASGVLDAGS